MAPKRAYSSKDRAHLHATNGDAPRPSSSPATAKSASLDRRTLVRLALKRAQELERAETESRNTDSKESKPSRNPLADRQDPSSESSEDEIVLRPHPRSASGPTSGRKAGSQQLSRTAASSHSKSRNAPHIVTTRSHRSTSASSSTPSGPLQFRRLSVATAPSVPIPASGRKTSSHALNRASSNQAFSLEIPVLSSPARPATPLSSPVRPLSAKAKGKRPLEGARAAQIAQAISCRDEYEGIREKEPEKGKRGEMERAQKQKTISRDGLSGSAPYLASMVDERTGGQNVEEREGEELEAEDLAMEVIQEPVEGPNEEDGPNGTREISPELGMAPPYPASGKRLLFQQSSSLLNPAPYRQLPRTVDSPKSTPAPSSASTSQKSAGPSSSKPRKIPHSFSLVIPVPVAASPRTATPSRPSSITSSQPKPPPVEPPPRPPPALPFPSQSASHPLNSNPHLKLCRFNPAPPPPLTQRYLRNSDYRPARSLGYIEGTVPKRRPPPKRRSPSPLLICKAPVSTASSTSASAGGSVPPSTAAEAARRKSGRSVVQARQACDVLPSTADNADLASSSLATTKPIRAPRWESQVKARWRFLRSDERGSYRQDGRLAGTDPGPLSFEIDPDDASTADSLSAWLNEDSDDEDSGPRMRRSQRSRSVSAATKSRRIPEWKENPDKVRDVRWRWPELRPKRQYGDDEEDEDEDEEDLPRRLDGSQEGSWDILPWSFKSIDEGLGAASNRATGWATRDPYPLATVDEVSEVDLSEADSQRDAASLSTSPSTHGEEEEGWDAEFARMARQQEAAKSHALACLSGEATVSPAASRVTDVFSRPTSISSQSSSRPARKKRKHSSPIDTLSFTYPSSSVVRLPLAASSYPTIDPSKKRRKRQRHESPPVSPGLDFSIQPPKKKKVLPPPPPDTESKDEEDELQLLPPLRKKIKFEPVVAVTGEEGKENNVVKEARAKTPEGMERCDYPNCPLPFFHNKTLSTKSTHAGNYHHDRIQLAWKDPLRTLVLVRQSTSPISAGGGAGEGRGKGQGKKKNGPGKGEFECPYCGFWSLNASSTRQHCYARKGRGCSGPPILQDSV
ncbi:hypothetical protein JCM11641_008357 [Rhodosporidiobolus odoratus]